MQFRILKRIDHFSVRRIIQSAGYQTHRVQRFVRGMRLHRLLGLIKLLQGPSSWNARRLAEHFEMSQRNVYRDLAILELAGVPYYYDAEFGEGGGYRIRSGWWFPSVRLTDQECLDLAVIARITETKSIPLLDQVSEVRDKLLATLPTKQQDLIAAASELFDILSIGMADHAGARRIMLTLQNAMLQGKQVEGTYRSPHQKQAVRVLLQPHRVFLAANAWYLAAHDNRDQQTKLYRLARFKEVKLLDRKTTCTQSFSLREFLGNAWAVHRSGRDWFVELQFDAETAAQIEEARWHHTQETERCSDGSVIMRVQVSGLEEIRFWVLRWGPHVRVLKPPELVDEVSDLAKRTLARYP